MFLHLIIVLVLKISTGNGTDDNTEQSVRPQILQVRCHQNLSYYLRNLMMSVNADWCSRRCTLVTLYVFHVTLCNQIFFWKTFPGFICCSCSNYVFSNKTGMLSLLTVSVTRPNFPRSIPLVPSCMRKMATLAITCKEKHAFTKSSGNFP